MRFISKFAMTVAAIFFALSVSAPASAGALEDKVYQVCKKWRVDQGGPMPTDQMQHCRNVLWVWSSCPTSATHPYSRDMYWDCYHATDTCRGSGAACVDTTAREGAKIELGYW